ncbi:unnamed protein product [Phytophthora fragariaefolia]|uniref:Unnamed protein product n=1 Tax=Phytophthora fragariaefolia TaxID=1490495 RepID=A0A9W7CWA2_9STRA|nr:unnamed protein product [Phytophthora fragariaefolia]
MRAEAQSAAQESATNTASFAARPTTMKPVKMSIALSAGQIFDARAQVAFALSNLGGRARAWAMARETATPGYFTSRSFMEQELRSTFLLANVAYRHRSNFLRCKQGKRSLQDYVMELHNLEVAMAGAPLSEDVKVTVFMDGVRTGPVSPSSTSPKEQVPETSLRCLSVAAARSNLVVVTASVKGYPDPMTVLICSGAWFNVATKASVARNNALYASALEASKSNTNVSVRLATGSIVSTRKVTIPLSVKFDDFNSVKPSIVLDMDDRYGLILGMPWLAKHDPWIDWHGFVHEHCVPSADRQFAGSSEVLQLPSASPPRALELEVGNDEDPQNARTPPVGRQGSAVCNRVAYVQGTVTPQGADAVTARAGKGGGVRAAPTHSVAAGSAHVEECAGVVARANKSGRAVTPTTQGDVAGSARATEGVGACARATTGGRAGAPTSKVIKGDKVTSTPKAEASDLDADSAAEDRAPQSLDDFTGEPKEGEVLTPLPTVAELLELEELPYAEFLDSPKAGELAEVVLLRSNDGSLELNSSSVMDSEVLEDERTSRRQTRYGAAILKDPSDPYYPLLKEFSDVVSDDPPSVLPPDWGVRHEIDLVPGTKYCTTWHRPLPKEQVDIIDAFFATKHAAGMVRESKSPHSSPTFCVRKPNGKWRVVHAFNKLNAATIPASTPIPRKDVLQNNMAGCTVFSDLDMVEGYYQLLMRESDIPLTAVKIPFLGCCFGKDGVRADPEKVCAIAQWPVPVSQKDLRKWLGLANYLHKYSANYADMTRPLTNLLKKDAVWSWTSEAQQAFEAIKSSLPSAPILALPGEDRPFRVVCDASDFAIGCALLQADAEGRERVVSFQSRQLKAAEKNYPVHDKELLAMKYALVKFRVHLLGKKTFVIYTDHASLRTATSSPHISQRMARWL